MRTLPADAQEQKGKIAAPGAWLMLLDVAYPSLTASPRTAYKLINNIRGYSYHGNYYEPWAFRLGQVREELKGGLPRVTLSLYDPALTLMQAFQDNAGFSTGEVSVRYVYIDPNHSITDPDIIQFFTILDTTWDDKDSVLNCNISVVSPLSRRFPRDRFVASACRHQFRGGLCRYGEDVDVYGDSAGLIANTRIALYQGTTSDYIRMWGYAMYSYFSVGQHIRVSGSTYNDNEYIIESVRFGENPGYGRFYLESDTRINQSENSSESIEITVTALCDRTITACRANNNSHAYGGSPGVAGGIYG